MMHDEIEKILANRSLGAISGIRGIDSYQNQVFDVFTNVGHYVIKYYDDDLLKKRRAQVEVSKIWNENGIKCILPVSDFCMGAQGYYVIYEYFDNDTRKRLSLDDIKKLAKIQAQIHNLNTSSSLSCDYKKIELDIKNDNIQDLIQRCNKGIANAKKNVVISHNDYKPKNILWRDDEPYLVDFDAVSKVNPTCAAYESALTFSYEKGKIDDEKFKAYLKEYRKYADFNDSEYLKYVCVNGKMRWLEFIYAKDWRRDQKLYEEVMNLVFELENYYNYIKN